VPEHNADLVILGGGSGGYACALRAAELGMSVVLVEQKLAIALKVSDRVCVMGHGRIVFEGTPAQLQSDPALLAQWLAV